MLLAISINRSLFTIRPAEENTRSLGTDVAGEKSTHKANWERKGKRSSFFPHHSSGSVMRLVALVFSLKYFSSRLIDFICTLIGVEKERQSVFIRSFAPAQLADLCWCWLGHNLFSWLVGRSERECKLFYLSLQCQLIFFSR